MAWTRPSLLRHLLRAGLTEPRVAPAGERVVRLGADLRPGQTFSRPPSGSKFAYPTPIVAVPRAGPTLAAWAPTVEPNRDHCDQTFRDGELWYATQARPTDPFGAPTQLSKRLAAPAVVATDESSILAWASGAPGHAHMLYAIKTDGDPDR
jgi:hypothetical protein